MADVNFTSLVKLITCYHCISFTVALVICKVNTASAVNVPQAHEYMRAIQPCNTDLYCIVVTSWHCVLHSKLAIKWCIALFGVKSIGYYNKKFTTSLRSLFLSFLYFFICPPQPTCSHSHITPYTMYGMALATHE